MRHNFFSKNHFSKLLMFMRQSEKIQKYFLRHAGHLLEQGSQHLFIYTYATQLFFKDPHFKVINVHATVRKNLKNASCDTLVTCWSKGHNICLYIYLCDTTFFQKPLFKVVNVHATVRKNPKNASCDTLVTCFQITYH